MWLLIHFLNEKLLLLPSFSDHLGCEESDWNLCWCLVSSIFTQIMPRTAHITITTATTNHCPLPMQLENHWFTSSTTTKKTLNQTLWIKTKVLTCLPWSKNKATCTRTATITGKANLFRFVDYGISDTAAQSDNAVVSNLIVI